MQAKYGLIGKDLSYSLSKEIHSIVNDNYDFYTCKNETEMIDLIESKKLAGFNVTIPYKESVMQYLDKIDNVAATIGSVNTVVLDKNKYVGYNTDHIGILKTLERFKIDFSTIPTLILGSGGSSKAVQYIMQSVGNNHYYIATRNKCNRDISKKIISYNDINMISDKIELVVNTTPIGMTKYIYKEPLIDVSSFKSLKYVFDLIYNPINTKLILAAKERNIKTQNGLFMLISQALAAEEIFLNKTISVEKFMRLEKLLMLKNSNIVFYGLSGAGKSIIGKEVSKLLDKAFYDTDLIIEKRLNMTVEDIFIKYGEDYFRNVEMSVIDDLGKVNNSCISLGGGAVLSSESVKKLKINGLFVHIKRPFDKIEKEGRPLYKKISPKALFAHRKDIYESLSDITFLNNTSDISLAALNCKNMILNKICTNV